MLMHEPGNLPYYWYRIYFRITSNWSYCKNRDYHPVFFACKLLILDMKSVRDGFFIYRFQYIEKEKIMKKKLLAAVLAAATSMSLLAGCGNAANEAQTEPETSAEAVSEVAAEEVSQEEKADEMSDEEKAKEVPFMFRKELTKLMNYALKLKRPGMPSQMLRRSL